MKKEQTRKCSICKQNIILNEAQTDYFIECKKNNTTTCTHIKCYIEHYTARKRNPKTIEECEEHIKFCKNNFNKLEKKKNIRNELYDFLFDMYNISYFPNYFYIKMDSVFKGTYKNLNRPVPPEDLLDMWKQKRNYLDKISEQNRKKGVDIIGANRVNYDLAILLSRYDAYLKWKEQQKLEVAETNEYKKRSVERIEYTDVIRPNKTNTFNKPLDLSSILNEI